MTVSIMETNIGKAFMLTVAPLASSETRSGVITGASMVDAVVMPTEKATSP